MSWAGEINNSGSGIMLVTQDGVRQIPIINSDEGKYLKIEDGYPKFRDVPSGSGSSTTQSTNIAMNLIWMGW